MSQKAMVKLFLWVGLFLGTVMGFAQHTTPVQLSQDHQQQHQPAAYFSSTSRLWAVDDEDVNVNLIPDVDAATLTAVGFGLIAFNFFVLANIGDGGLGGALATIINTLNQ